MSGTHVANDAMPFDSGESTLLRDSLKNLCHAVSGSISLFHVREVNPGRRDTRVCQRLLVPVADPIDSDDCSP